MDLITLEEYKDNESITNTKDDFRLQNLITSVSQLVKTYCSNSFLDYFSTPTSEEFTIKYATDGLQLSEGPVRSVTLVEERRNPVSAYEALTSADFHVDYSSDIVYRTNSTGFYQWPIGPGAVRITYTAGYASIPEDLRLAVYDLVTYYRKNEHKERRQLSGASMANQGSSSIWRNADFPDHIKRVLDLHKQIQV